MLSIIGNGQIRKPGSQRDGNRLAVASWTLVVLACALLAVGPTSVVAGTKVAAGGFHTCALKDSGKVRCWGADTWGQASPPPAKFKSVSAGTVHTCGVKRSAKLSCWGFPPGGDGQALPPPGEFKSVSAGDTHTCGVRKSDKVSCWGDDTYGQTDVPPAFR